MRRTWLPRIEGGDEFNVIISAVKRVNIMLVALAASSNAITSSFGVGDEFARISGGRAVMNMSGWEFIASIRVSNDPLCSGLILSNRYTLTTCKCANLVNLKRDLGRDVVIVAGTLNAEDKSSGQRRQIGGSTNHPHCSKDTLYNRMSGFIFDYAVLEVTPIFVVGGNVKPVVLPTWNQREIEYLILEALKQSTRCEVAGWGKTLVQFPTQYSSPSPVLLKMTLELVTWERCSSVVCRGGRNQPYCNSAVLLTGKICANPIGPGNSCNGDEGGPLVCDGVVLALISHIQSCGEHNEPNFYARLDIALPFIRKYVNAGVGARTVRSNLLTQIIIFMSLLCK